ncbi:hypothetical protein HPB51_010356 [Rhipicephalus microplus]|uniref:Uncharacterized protein n=1 Tax=Rhipicephalus microplus TaxID=6941 RepID=A0A9J6E7K9_RHIMP|nr:hypothetical protein HPB51_010356 [Rhipicephalus microplus]
MRQWTPRTRSQPQSTQSSSATIAAVAWTRACSRLWVLTTSELQQLSALDDEGPLAPANSLESLDSRAGPSEGARSLETPRSSFGSSDRAEDQLQPVPGRATAAANRSRDLRVILAIKETTSEKAKAQRPSHGASTVPLACGAVLMIVFLLAFAYGVFLFRLAHAPAPVKKIGMQRSANDTGADRG